MTQLTDTVQHVQYLRVQNSLASAVQIKGKPGSWELWKGTSKLAGPFKTINKGDPKFEHGHWAIRVGDGTNYRLHTEHGVGKAVNRLGRVRLNSDGIAASEAFVDAGVAIQFGDNDWGPFEDAQLFGVSGDRVAFSSKSGDQWTANYGSEEKGTFALVVGAAFTTDSVVWTVQDEGAWWVVTNEDRFGPYRDIGPAQTHGNDVLWGAKDETGWAVYKNGNRSDTYERIGGLTLDDGGHPTYWAMNGGEAFVIRNGVKSQAWQSVSAAPILTNGDHLVYAAKAQTGKLWSVVVDGKVVDEVDVAGLWLSGTHVAWLSASARNAGVLTVRNLASSTQVERQARMATDVGGGLVFTKSSFSYTDNRPAGLFRVDGVPLP